MNLTVKVLHAVGPGMFASYRPEGSDLFHAHDFDVVADNPEQAADLVWTLCNVDDANHLSSIRSDLSIYGAQVTAYRQRKNRSLSMGDVLVFFEGDHFVTAMAIEAMGHREYPLEPVHAGGSNEDAESSAFIASRSLSLMSTRDLDNPKVRQVLKNALDRIGGSLREGS